MKIKDKVKLKPKERKLLKQLISKGSEKARKITRCRILLLANEGKTDTQIIEALRVARNTIRTVLASRWCSFTNGERGGGEEHPLLAKFVNRLMLWQMCSKRQRNFT